LQDNGVGESLDPNVKIGCNLDEFGNPQSFLTQQADGSVLCEANGGSGNGTIFSLEDINGYFQESPQAKGPAELSLSEGLYQGKMRFSLNWPYYDVSSSCSNILFVPRIGLFMQLVGGNMFKLFTEENFLGVIVLGAGFGVGKHTYIYIHP